MTDIFMVANTSPVFSHNAWPAGARVCFPWQPKVLQALLFVLSHNSQNPSIIEFRKDHAKESAS